jgi:hypothetical protein
MKWANKDHLKMSKMIKEGEDINQMLTEMFKCVSLAIHASPSPMISNNQLKFVFKACTLLVSRKELLLCIDFIDSLLSSPSCKLLIGPLLFDFIKIASSSKSYPEILGLLIDTATKAITKCPANKKHAFNDTDLLRTFTKSFPISREISTQVSMLAFLYRLTPVDNLQKKVFFEKIQFDSSFALIDSKDFAYSSRRWLENLNGNKDLGSILFHQIVVEKEAESIKFTSDPSNAFVLDFNLLSIEIPQLENLSGEEFPLKIPICKISAWKALNDVDHCDLKNAKCIVLQLGDFPKKIKYLKIISNNDSHGNF